MISCAAGGKRASNICPCLYSLFDLDSLRRAANSFEQQVKVAYKEGRKEDNNTSKGCKRPVCC